MIIKTPFGPVLGPGGIVPFPDEEVRQKFAEVGVVFAEEDVELLLHDAVVWGKTKVNVLPSPDSLTTSILAPCCCMTACT